MTTIYLLRHSQPFRKLLGEYNVSETEQISTYSKVQQENCDLKDKNETLKFQNTKLSNKVSILENIITVLKRTIERVADFFYHLVADGLISKKKEEEIHNILGSDYKPYKENSRDDGLSL